MYNQFRNGTAGHYLGCSSSSGLLPAPRGSSSETTGGEEAAGWKEGSQLGWQGSGGGTKRVGTPGGVRVCLEGCGGNELELYMKTLNLFSQFPCHEQDPGALEPEGQLPHSFPGVSLLKKKKKGKKPQGKKRLFVALTL